MRSFKRNYLPCVRIMGKRLGKKEAAEQPFSNLVTIAIDDLMAMNLFPSL